MNLLVIGVILFIMAKSFMQFVTANEEPSRVKIHRAGISLEVFYTLLIIYCIVIIGFGLIYFLLSFHEPTLFESVKDGKTSTVSLFLRCFYFSGVTLLTIGYGDISPLGIGRIVAIVQALIGYLLPTAFVLKMVHLNLRQKG